MIKIKKRDFFNYTRSDYSSERRADYTNGEIEGIDRIPGRPNRYYLRYFDKVRFGQGILCWNWSAFFFSYVWLAYRKMYVPLFVLSLFAAVYLPAAILVMLFLGFFGNYIYLQAVILRKQRAARNRGVSILAAIFGTIFISLLASFSAGIFFK